MPLNKGRYDLFDDAKIAKKRKNYQIDLQYHSLRHPMTNKIAERNAYIRFYA